MKTFPLQLEDDLHRRLKHAAVDADVSLHEWILTALKEKLDHGAPKPSSPARPHDRRKP